jgi:hypothetical protein
VRFCGIKILFLPSTLFSVLYALALIFIYWKYQTAVRIFKGCAGGKAVFQLCAIAASLAAFPGPSGTAAEYPHRILGMLFAMMMDTVNIP